MISMRDVDEDPIGPVRRTPVSVTYTRRPSSQTELATAALRQTPSTEEWDALFAATPVPAQSSPSPAKATRSSPRHKSRQPPAQQAEQAEQAQHEDTPPRRSPRKRAAVDCPSDASASAAHTPKRRILKDEPSPGLRRSPRTHPAAKAEIPVTKFFPIFRNHGRAAPQPQPPAQPQPRASDCTKDRTHAAAPAASVVSSAKKPPPPPPPKHAPEKPRRVPEAGGAGRQDKLTQLVLDAGQRSLGFHVCEECGMGYTAGVPGDEQAHARHHAAALRAIPFPGWKNENVVREHEDGSRVICVTRRDEPRHIKKVDQIRGVVDQELGFASAADGTLPDTFKVYLYIADAKVAGCCVAEPLRHAFALLDAPGPAHGGPCHRNALDEAPAPAPAPGIAPIADSSLCASTTPEPAVMGISRIWVAKRMRRRNVASRLVDAARASFQYGQAVPLHLIAFSQPTADGRAFAAKYTGRPTFLVY